MADSNDVDPKDAERLQGFEELSEITIATKDQNKEVSTDTNSNDVSGNANETDTQDSERKQKIDQYGRAYATGKRKNAIARVWLKPGKGQITVNGKKFNSYFARPVLQIILRQPLAVTNKQGAYDINCTVKGGGLSGQAGAVRHGIAKALQYYDPELRPVLKKAKFLVRDPRVVERKKYGRRKARRSFQFSKR